MFSVILNRQYDNENIIDMDRRVFFGNFFHTISFDQFETVFDGFIAVEAGKIIEVGKRSQYAAWQHPNKGEFIMKELNSDQFLIPGFVDTHIHAPQVPNIGLGLDKPLLDWLNAYTFPMESEFKNDDFARHVYEKVVNRTLSCGTTTACYYGTIHKNACKILADNALTKGQRAFIGKVAMNQNSPENYIEKADQSISDNRELIDYICSLKSDRITPIITPRFAISCDMEFMKKLAGLAREFNLPIQSHISENVDEITFTLEIFPGHKNYAEVYNTAGLLTNRTIMAHGVHLYDGEVKMFADKGVAVAHCPNSNTNLQSGLLDVKRLIDNGVKVGLGSDVSGGNRIGILDCMRAALDASHHLNFMKKQNVLGTGKMPETKSNMKYQPMTYQQALFLATLGGAQTCGLENKIGNFVKGKEFDALVIDVYVGSVDKFNIPAKVSENWNEEFKFHQMIQKFVYVGDDRNIAEVYVQGKQVK